MTLSAVENAMRVSAAAWASANGLSFVFDNDVGLDPTVQPSLNTILWQFRPDDRRRITASVVEHSGECRGIIMVPALPASTSTGNPVADRISLAQGLIDNFRGRTFSGAIVLDESSITTSPVIPPMATIEATIRWQYSEAHDAVGITGTPSGDGVARAYDAWRQLWNRVDTDLTVYFDGIPPGLAVNLPAAVCSFSVSPGIPIEMQTTRHVGRVNCGLHYELETGVQSSQSDVNAIIEVFDSASVGGVAFGSPRTTIIGRTAGDTWQVNVSLPFGFNDTFTS